MRAAELVSLRASLLKTSLVEDCTIVSRTADVSETGGRTVRDPVETYAKCRFIPRGSRALDDYGGRLGVVYSDRFLFLDDVVVDQESEIRYGDDSYSVTSSVTRTPVPLRVVGVVKL